MNIARRYGTTPRERGSASGANCPDVLRLDTGDYLIIGKLKQPTVETEQALAAHGASVGPDEAVVVVPADMLHAAARDIVKEQPGPGHAAARQPSTPTG